MDRSFESDARAASAGVALFLSTFYLFSLIPALVAGAGVPYAAAAVGVYAVTIGFNLFSAWWTGLGLLFAPAIGIALFMKDFQNSLDLPWQVLLLAAAVAGLGSVLHTFQGFRDRVIAALPSQVENGLATALAALFARQSYLLLKDTYPDDLALALALTAVAVCGLVLAMFWRASPGWQEWYDRQPLLVRLLAHAEIPVVVIALALAAQALDVAPAQPAPAFVASDIIVISALFEPPSVHEFFLALIFAAAVWFILLTDIPGTPQVVLPRKVLRARAQHVQAAVRIDSMASATAPLLGVVPTIFYAENFLLRAFRDPPSKGREPQAEGRFGARVVVVCCAGFGMLFALDLLFWSGMIPFGTATLIPPLATAPIVVFIAYLIGSKAVGIGQARIDKRKREPRQAEIPEQVIEPLPGFVAGLFTVIGLFEIGFCLAVIVGYLCEWLARPDEQSLDPTIPQFLFIGAALLLIVRIAVAASIEG